MRSSLFTVTLAVFLLSGANLLMGFDLVKGNKIAEIVLPENPYPGTELAAKELSDYTEKVSGKKLKIVKGKSNAPVKIFIGTLDTLKNIPSSAKKALEKAKQSEAYYISAKGNTLYIIGKSEVADLYATYQFMEDKYGIRWLVAADKVDSGEYVPKKKEIAFPDYEKFREPAFAFRRIDQCGSFGNVIPYNGKIWANRNGYQTPTPYGRPIPYNDKNSIWYKFYAPRIPRTMQTLGGGHLTFATPIPAKVYFEKHPEYFALIDGKRKKGSQYCLANKDVRRLVKEYIIKKLDSTGGIGSYLFGMVDVNDGWCECAECKALDGTDTVAAGFQNVSTRFQKTVKAISDEVLKKYPDADLRTWSYHTYRELPSGVKLDDRIKIQYCPHGRCYGHNLDDPSCPRNVRLYQLLLGWLKVAPQVYTYEYFAASPPYYTCNEKVQAHDLRLYKKLGMAGWKEEGYFADSKFYPPRKNDTRGDIKPSIWQWAFVTGKLLWDPSLDEEKLLEEAENLYYGKAAVPMRKYHNYRRKLWNNTPQCMGYPHGDHRRANILNAPGAKEKLLALLDEADRLAKGDKILQYRLKKDRHYLTSYWIKPNETMKAKFGNTLRAPVAKSKIKIDGNGNDPAWVGAFYLTKGLKQPFTEKKLDLPDPLATSFGILSDKENLYFLIEAKEPHTGKMIMNGRKDHDVWKDDSIEIFLYPPTAANSYYHIAVNPRGAVYDELGPGAKTDYDLPVEVKTKIHSDRYVIELKIPVSRLKRPERGDIWKVNFARNRRVKDGILPDENMAGSFSLDGILYHNISAFRPMEIGDPHIKNGSFDDVDAKTKKAKNWTVRGKNASIVKENGSYALKLAPGDAYQLMASGDVGQKKYARKIAYTFRAKGKGKLFVNFFRYSDKTDPKAKHGYTRTHFPQHGKGGVYTLTEKMQIFHGEYTIAPNEWVAFDFAANNAIIDDLSVRLVK